MKRREEGNSLRNCDDDEELRKITRRGAGGFRLNYSTNEGFGLAYDDERYLRCEEEDRK
jgi:hypothetical protein